MKQVRRDHVTLRGRASLPRPESPGPPATFFAIDQEILNRPPEGASAHPFSHPTRVRRDAAVRLLPERRLRGEVKLAHALGALEVPVAGRVALDVGASAGGFTAALLNARTRRVYAVDAGVGQLLGPLTPASWIRAALWVHRRARVLGASRSEGRGAGERWSMSIRRSGRRRSGSSSPGVPRWSRRAIRHDRPPARRRRLWEERTAGRSSPTP